MRSPRSSMRLTPLLGAALAAAAVATALAATAGSVAGQTTPGLTYDMNVTTTGPGVEGTVATRPMMAAHGQFAGTNSRVDYAPVGGGAAATPAPEGAGMGGFMSPGTYMIVTGVNRVAYFVNPAQHRYMEFNADSMSKLATKMEASLGGMVKMDMTDVTATGENLGPGESIEGHRTVRYRVANGYTMNMSIMGHSTRTTERSTSDLWIATDLNPLVNPMPQNGMASAPGGSAAYAEALRKAYAGIPKGVPLKSVTHTVSVSDGKSTVEDMTMTITNIKSGPVNKAAFEIPAGYTKNDSFNQMGAVGSMLSDSLTIARKGTSRTTTGAAGGDAATLPGASAGAPKTDQAKQDAKDQAKAAVRVHP